MLLLPRMEDTVMRKKAHRINLAVQFISETDEIGMNGDGFEVTEESVGGNIVKDRVRSMIIAVYSYLYLDRKVVPVTSEQYPAFFTYLRADDTWESLANRISEFTGENWQTMHKLSVIRGESTYPLTPHNENAAHSTKLADKDAEDMKSEIGTDGTDTSSEASPQGQGGSLSSKAIPSIWSTFALYYPAFASKNLASALVHGASAAPVVYPQLGIERNTGILATQSASVIEDFQGTLGPVSRR